MTGKFLPALLLCCSVTGIAIAQPCNLTPTASTVTTPICSDRPLQFTATNIPGATYEWKDPGNNTFSYVKDGLLPTLPPLGTGNYTVTITVGACVYNVQVPINTIDLTPTVPVITQLGPVCPGKDDRLSAASSGAPGLVYLWTLNDNSTFNGKDLDRIDVDENMEGVYTVVGSTLMGCKSDPATIMFKIHPRVTADFNFNIDLGCKEDLVQFSNQSTGGTTFDWDFGNGIRSNDFAPLHAYTIQPATYNIRFIASNQFCKDTVFKQIVLNHPLSADFTVDDDTICQKTPINFTNQSSDPVGGIHQYAWYLMDGSAVDAKEDISHTYITSGSYKAMLVVTDFLGCTDTAWKDIFVDSAGFADFTISKNNICAGQNLSIEGSYSKVGALGNSWDLNDGNQLSNTTAFPYAYDKAGLYTVQFHVDYRICPSVTVSKDILVKATPKIDLGPDTTICPNGQRFVIKDRINEGNDKAIWKWNIGKSDNISSQMIAAPGTYRAEVTIDGCTGGDEVVVRKSCYLDLPNAFTPDGDGIGDYFLPRQLLSSSLSNFKMTVFNRWGGIVFESSNINGRGWDGTMNGVQQPVGVYPYIIQAKFANDKAETYSGNVTLLR